MADQVDIYQRAFDAESQRLRQAEGDKDNRIQRQKMMLDLIRAQEPLSAEDARDLSDLENLDVPKRARLLSSLYAKSPTTAFPMAVTRLGQIDYQAKTNDNRIDMESLRSIIRQENKTYERTIASPSEQEYQEQYGPMFQSMGQQLPPYGGQTYSELNRQVTAARGAKTQPGGKGSPLDQPAGADFIAGVFRAEGLTPPAEMDWQNWTHRELNTFFLRSTPAKPPGGGTTSQAPKELTPVQKITTQDEAKNYALGQAWPALGMKGARKAKYGPERTALGDYIAARAVREGGDIQANIDRMLAEEGITDKMGGGEAVEALKRLRAKKPAQSDDAAAKKAAIKKALLGR